MKVDAGNERVNEERVCRKLNSHTLTFFMYNSNLLEAFKSKAMTAIEIHTNTHNFELLLVK